MAASLPGPQKGGFGCIQLDMGLGLLGFLGFRVFRVWGLGFLGFRVWGLGFKV